MISLENQGFPDICAASNKRPRGPSRIARPWLSFGTSSGSLDGEMGWTVFTVLQETRGRIRGTKKSTTQEAVDVEALIMRLTFKEATYSIA